MIDTYFKLTVHFFDTWFTISNCHKGKIFKLQDFWSISRKQIQRPQEGEKTTVL